MYRILVGISAVFLIIFLPMVILSLVKGAKKTEAAWWDDTWQFRKKVVATNTSGSAITDYQVGFFLGTLASSAIRSDCSDIRVTDINGVLISDPYWVDCNDSTNPTVWVKFSSLPKASTVLYIYYGNPSATTSKASSGSTVFPDFFADFAGITIDVSKFTYGGGGSITQNEYLTVLNNNDAWDTYVYTATQARSADRVFYSKFKAAAGNRSAIGWHDGGSGTGLTDMVYALYFNNGTFGIYEDNTSRTCATCTTYTTGTWYDVKVELKATGAKYYTKLTTSGTWTLQYDSAYSSETPLRPAMVHYDAAEYSYTDNWRVGKYVTTEPTLTIASQESAPSPVANWKFDEGRDEPYNKGLTTLEQQLNIYNGIFAWNSATWGPSDNSLGIVHWDASKYPGATVYFEAVMQTVGWNDTAYAKLYTTSGTALDSSQVSVGTGSSSYYVLSRTSNPISLTDNTDYTVRVYSSSGSRYVYLKAARIIVVQASENGIQATQTQIELGANESTTNTSFTSLTDKKYYQYDSSKFSPQPTVNFEATFSPYGPKIEQQINLLDHLFETNSTSYWPSDYSTGIIKWDSTKFTGDSVYFEVVMYTDGYNDTGYAALYDTADPDTAVTTLSGGTGAGGGSSYAFRLRSAAPVTLTDGHYYYTRFASSTSFRYIHVLNARLIVLQSDNTRLTDTQTQIDVGNIEATNSASFNELWEKKIYSYNSSRFNPAPSAYLEASFRPYTPKFEQQINIIDQEYLRASTSYGPTDNSLGLVRWDSSKYTGDTVYFEAILSTLGYNDTAYAMLVDSNGNGVTSSQLSVFTGSGSYYVLVRSSALTLNDGWYYTVRTKGSSGTRNVKLLAARLIVTQSDATKITDTETQVEMGNYQTGFTNTTYLELTDPKYYEYKQSRFSPTPESAGDVEFHATLNIADSADTAYAELYNRTNGQTVAEVSVTATTAATLKIATNVDADADWDTTNADEYSVRVKCADNNGGGCSGTISNAKIVLDQSSGSGVTALETPQQHINTLYTGTGTGYTLADYQSLYTPTNFGVVPDVYYEATMKTSAGTGYVRVYDDYKNADITTTLSTTGTSYSRVTSQYDQNRALDQFQRTVTTEINNSGANTTSVSNSWLLLRMTNIPTSGISSNSAVDLYDITADSVVGGSTLTASDGGFYHYRSGSLSLTSGNLFKVRIREAWLASAKIVLEQSSAGGISALETAQAQITSARSTTSTSYTNLGYRTYYSPENFGVVPQVYFEAVMRSSGTGYVQLRDNANGSGIAGTELTTTSGTYTVVTTGSDIYANMGNAPRETTVQIKVSSGATMFIDSSWMLYRITSLPTGGASGGVELYNSTDSQSVTGSTLSPSGIGFIRVRTSSPITLTTGKQYEVRIKEAKLVNAKIIFDQASITGVSSLETQEQSINSLHTYTGTSPTAQFAYNQYTPSSFKSLYRNDTFQATIKGAAGNATAQLYTSAGSAISGATATTGQSSYQFVTSGSIYSALPISTTTMDTRLYNSGSNLTSVAGSALMVSPDNRRYRVTHDLSTYAQHADVVGAAWAPESECKSQRCLLFDGVNDYVVAEDHGSLDFAATDSFTIGMWIKRAPKSSGTETLLAKFLSTTGTDGGYKILMESDGDITVGIDDDSTWGPDASVTSTAANYDDNAWHYITMVKDTNSTLYLYIDGTLINSVSISGVGTLANTDNLYIGIDGDGSTNPFKGYIDEVKIYPYARTVDSIKSDMVSQSSEHGAQAVLGVSDQSSLASGLAGYWKMDETSGTVADSSGNGYTGTWYGTGTHYGAGKFGGGGNFNGSDDYVQTTAQAATVFGNGSASFTVAAWLKPQTFSGTFWKEVTILGANATVGGCQTSGGLKAEVTDASSATVYFALPLDSGADCADISAVSDTTMTTLNEWHHFVGTYDAITKTMTLYKDGSLVGTTTWAGNGAITWTGSGYIKLSNNYADLYMWSGGMDEARIYNRALSPGEISQLYNYAPGPVAWWKMDEGTGTSVYDSSGNNLTGTLTGSPAWTTGRMGSAINVDAAAKYAAVGDNDLLDMDYLISVSAWIKRDPAGLGYWNTILDKYETSGGNDWEYWFGFNSDNTLEFMYNPGTKDDADRIYVGNGQSALVLTDTTSWHFVSATYDGVTVRLYIDGVLKYSESHADDIYDGTGGLYIGTSGSDLTTGSTVYYRGNIDDVKIYTYARTAAQIVSDMNAGHPAPGSPVGSALVEYSFDEGYGDAAHNSGNGGTAYDGNLAGANSCPGNADCPIWTANGKFGKALSFDGGDYLNTSAALNLTGDDKFTVSFWLNWTSYADDDAQVVESSTNFNDNTAAIRISPNSSSGGGGKMELSIHGFGYRSELFERPSAGAWHHYAAIFDPGLPNGDITLYVDGNEVASTVSLDSFNGPYTGFNNYTWYLMSRAGSSLFGTGKLDDFRVYSAGLTAEQVKQLFNQGKSVVMGAQSTDSSGNPDNSAARAYCIPGDSSTCNPPVGEWMLNEGNGTTVNDSSGNDIAGTFSGSGSLWSTGKSGNAGVFNGSDTVVDFGVGSVSNKLNGAGAVTLETWMKPDAYPGGTSRARMISIHLADGYSGALLSTYGTGSVEVAGRSGIGDSLQTATYAVSDPTSWHFVVGIFDYPNDQIRIYLDGRLVQTQAVTFTNTSYTTGTLTDNHDSLGSYKTTISGDFYQGQLDNVRVYNYARTQTQIAWDYNRGAPVGWWKFDECQGATAYNSGFSASGAAPGNDATITIGSGPNNTSAGSCSSGQSAEAWNNGTTGKRNASIDFDGNDDYAVTGAFSPFAKAGESVSNVSWGGWFYPKTGIATKTLIEKGSEVRLQTDASGNPICDIYTGGGFTANTAGANAQALPLNSWSRVLCTYDGTNIRVYINGRETDSWSPGGSITAASSILYMGENSSGANRFQGQVDDIRIYGYALTAKQVLTDFNQDAAVRFGPATGSP